MADHLEGVQKIRIEQETITVPASAQAVELKLPKDFNVNYIVLDHTFLGATDRPTLLEMLAKMGTFDIKTKKGVGQWITGLDFNDFHYAYQLAVLQGQIAFLIGEGGGDNDLANNRIILDAGCGLNISSKCAWTPEMETILKINYIADGAILDNGELNVRYIGYEGRKPSRVKGIKSLTPTLTSGQEVDISVQEGDILQSMFAFLTTELDLATLQATTAPTLEELRIFSGKRLEQTFDVFTMIDGMDNSDDGNLGQYINLDFDRMKQGLGIEMNLDPKLVLKAGTSADAGRFYANLLEKVV